MNNKKIAEDLWALSNILRDDGITYHQYVTELTYLLFLKMMKETGQDHILPQNYRWDDLLSKDGIELKNFYKLMLLELGQADNELLKEIYTDAATYISEPKNLYKIVTSIDALDWYSAKQEGLGDLYERLLEKNASELKSDAGQYFTPRVLIDVIVKMVNPQPGERCYDPAAGTFGFMIAADRHVRSQTNDYFDEYVDPEFQKNRAFSGVELVKDAHRLAIMNALLHDIHGDIVLGDTLSTLGESMRNYDVILSNPPFGTKKGGEGITRTDFTFTTSNKQLNFLQHIYRALKPNGKSRAAVVLPDNVLFESGVGAQIRRDLMNKCNLHMILRLPTGIFYGNGVKTSVLFFSRGAKDTENTKEVWVYDLRTDMPLFNKKNPITGEHFNGFVNAYIAENRHNINDDRLSVFSRKEIAERNENLDIGIDPFYSEDNQNGDEIHTHSDQPTDEDFLGRDIYASVLAQTMVTAKQETKVIGLFGEWGEGKSSFIKLIEKKLASNQITKWKFSSFNANELDDKESIWSNITHSLFAKLKLKYKFLFLCNKYMSTIFFMILMSITFWITLSFISKDIVTDSISNIRNPLAYIASVVTEYTWFSFISWVVWIILSFTFINRHYEKFSLIIKLAKMDFFNAKIQFKKDIEKLLKYHMLQEHNVLLAVDELDRCSLEKVMETLEAFQILLDIKFQQNRKSTSGNLFIVYSINHEVLKQALFLNSQKYFEFEMGSLEPEKKEAILRKFTFKYMDKYIHVPFYLNSKHLSYTNYINHLLDDFVLPMNMKDIPEVESMNKRINIDQTNKEYNFNTNDWATNMINGEATLVPTNIENNKTEDINQIFKISYKDSKSINEAISLYQGLDLNSREVKKIVNIMFISKMIIERKMVKNPSKFFEEYIKIFLDLYVQFKTEGKYKDVKINNNIMKELLSLFLPYF